MNLIPCLFLNSSPTAAPLKYLPIIKLYQCNNSQRKPNLDLGSHLSLCFLKAYPHLCIIMNFIQGIVPIGGPKSGKHFLVYLKQMLPSFLGSLLIHRGMSFVFQGAVSETLEYITFMHWKTLRARKQCKIGSHLTCR